MSGAFLRRRDRTARPPRVEHYSSAVNTRALVQMATGAGKTFTAITQVYRLLKHADARRILFLVDTQCRGIGAVG